MMRQTKDKKAQMGFPVVMGLIFAVILAVIGITIATSLNNTATTLTSADQSIVYTSAPNNQSFTLTPIDRDSLTVATFRLYNATFNHTTDNYTINTAGELVVFSNANETLTAAWTYQAFGYVTGVTSTMILLIPLFMALAAIGIAAAFAGKSV